MDYKRLKAGDGSAALSPGWRAFALAFLLIQLAVPAAWYLGEGGYDERFRWRMFSTLRLQNCQITLTDIVVVDGVLEERPVNPHAELQVAWVNLLKRHRKGVVHKYLHARCELPGVQSAHYVRHCLDTDNSPLMPQPEDLECDLGQIAQSEPR